MITASNYNTQITKVNFSELPPVMQKMHDQLIVEKNGLNYYGKNDDITRVIDTYLDKLNNIIPSMEKPTKHEVKKTPKLPANSVVIEVRGLSNPSKVEGYMAVRHNGTIESVREANDSAFESAVREYGDYVSNANSARLITDENGIAVFSISPNGKVIRDKAGNEVTPFKNENSNNRKSASSAGTSRKATSRKSASASSGSQSKPKAGSKKRATSAKANNGSKAKPKAKVAAKRKPTTTKPKTATKAKSTTPRKEVEKPLVHRRVKSPELTAITRFINLNGKKKTLASLESFLKIVTNALASKKYVDHKPLMAKIKTNLQKGIKVMKDNSLSSVLVEFDEKLLEQCQKVQANAKEKLRVSYLGGTPEIDWEFIEFIKDQMIDYSIDLDGEEETVFAGTYSNIEDYLIEKNIESLKEEIEDMPDWYSSLKGMALKQFKFFHSELKKGLRGKP